MPYSQIMNDDIIEWIKNNLQYSRGLICKKCKREWFEKYGHIEKWEQIHTITSFLDILNPTFPQRIWHILHNQLYLIKCANPLCNTSPNFWSFNEGYLDTCSPSCAQYNPVTQEKIKTTNLQKYGKCYGLQNRTIIDKRRTTIQQRYGVENISQVNGISNKKEETCLKNYGTKWFLERTDLVGEYVKEKYGVKNVQQVNEISDKSSRTKMNEFYDELMLSNRFNGRVTPRFTKKEYNGTGKEYKFQCNTCQTEFVYDLRWGRIPRCPVCFKGSSVFEKEITDYIKFLLPSENILENTRTILANNKELDAYIPSKKVAIECDGLFWHGELGGNKGHMYHQNKTNECELQGIHLIHIFEDEWILTPEIVKRRLLHILGKNKSGSVYARNCKIKELTTEEKNIFLEETHIQGHDKSKIKLGLYHNTNLVSVMTFDKCRIFMNSRSSGAEYELIRYSASTSVVGGASKLLSYFIKTYHPKKIISYADRRWTDGLGSVCWQHGGTGSWRPKPRVGRPAALTYPDPRRPCLAAPGSGLP